MSRSVYLVALAIMHYTNFISWPPHINVEYDMSGFVTGRLHSSKKLKGNSILGGE